MMKVLGLTQEAFQLMTTKPREKDAKRATGFWKFMTAHSTDMQLRICSLCLVLTQHATNISAKKGLGVPTLAALSQGYVQERTSQDFDILQNVDKDPFYRRNSKEEVVKRLLLIEAHICIKFAQYGRFPMLIWSLTRAFNLVGYIACCEDFLLLPEAQLDVYHSLELRKEAIAHGTAIGSAESWLAGALVFLTFDAVQAELVKVMDAHGNSLEVKRKHWCIKRGEGRRGTPITSVVTAS